MKLSIVQNFLVFQQTTIIVESGNVYIVKALTATDALIVKFWANTDTNV